jgi:hypothetical protein
VRAQKVVKVHGHKQSLKVLRYSGLIFAALGDFDVGRFNQGILYRLYLSLLIPRRITQSSINHTLRLLLPIYIQKPYDFNKKY